MQDFGRLIALDAAGIATLSVYDTSNHRHAINRPEAELAIRLHDLRQSIDQAFGGSIHPMNPQVHVAGDQRKAGRIHESFRYRQSSLQACKICEEPRHLPKMREEQVKEMHIGICHVPPVARKAMKDHRRVLIGGCSATKPEAGTKTTSRKSLLQVFAVSCAQCKAAVIALDLILSPRLGSAPEARVEQGISPSIMSRRLLHRPCIAKADDGNQVILVGYKVLEDRTGDTQPQFDRIKHVGPTSVIADRAVHCCNQVVVAHRPLALPTLRFPMLSYPG